MLLLNLFIDRLKMWWAGESSPHHPRGFLRVIWHSLSLPITFTALPKFGTSGQGASLQRIWRSMALWLVLGLLGNFLTTPVALARSQEKIEPTYRLGSYDDYTTKPQAQMEVKGLCTTTLVPFLDPDDWTNKLGFDPCYVYEPPEGSSVLPDASLFKRRSALPAWASTGQQPDRFVFLLYDDTVFQFSFQTIISRYEPLLYPSSNDILRCDTSKPLTSKGCTTTTSYSRAKLDTAAQEAAKKKAKEDAEAAKKKAKEDAAAKKKAKEDAAAKKKAKEDAEAAEKRDKEDAEAKLKDAEAKLKDAEAKLKDAEAAEKSEKRDKEDAEAKLKDAEAKCAMAKNNAKEAADAELAVERNAKAAALTAKLAAENRAKLAEDKLAAALKAQKIAVKDIQLGFEHSCLLTTTGDVKCWGSNEFGQLGDGTTTNKKKPTKVSGLSGVVVRAIAVGASHSCALTTTGNVKCWGKNEYGQLGDGTSKQQKKPVKVSGLNGARELSDIRAIVLGSFHSCALTTTGGVNCWGLDGFQHGNNETTVHPVAISNLSGVRALGAGNSYSCALTMTGDVKCFGDNSSGQLGDGTDISRYKASNNVSNLRGVHAIAVGPNHSCALTTTGDVKCWGLNDVGQLGDGTTTAKGKGKNKPVKVT